MTSETTRKDSKKLLGVMVMLVQDVLRVTAYSCYVKLFYLLSCSIILLLYFRCVLLSKIMCTPT